MKRKIRKLTDPEENEIRGDHFRRGIAAAAICEKWGIPASRLRRIIGGPTTSRCKGVEDLWV